MHPLPAECQSFSFVGLQVAFLEWTDPLFNGGHWTPGLIAMAGESEG